MIGCLRFVLLLTSASVAGAGLGRPPEENSRIFVPWVGLSSPDQRLSAYLCIVLHWHPRVSWRWWASISRCTGQQMTGRKAVGPGADLTTVNEFVQSFLKLFPLEKYT